MSLRDLILSVDDRPVVEPVEVPEWGTTVYFRTMTLGERLAAFRSKTEAEQETAAKLLVLTLCDAEGNRIFTLDDVKPISEKNGAVLQRLSQIAMRLNGLLEADTKEAEKN